MNPAEPTHFAPLESALLLLLCAVSATLFFLRFAPILRTILTARKELGVTLTRIPHRLWVFTSEVLCQSKVIRERPIPGLAHAFVFWGFLAFALVTLNHLALALHLAFLLPQSLAARLYFAFVAAWAVLVAISIAGLFVRRFLIRPIWLGARPSYESGLIAALIFTLMATYLADFLPGLTQPTLKALWWTHTLALLVFLPLIPHTKHLHLVLSPFAIFLKRDTFSQLPPLSTDDTVEDFGLVSGHDLTQIIALQAYSCVECGRCTEHCPASATGKVLNPKEVVLATRSYLNTFGPASTVPLLTDLRDPSPSNLEPIPSALSLEAAYACTTCGACEYQCPVGIQHLPILIGLRRGATNTGAWEDPYGTKLFLALERSGNALGMPAADRDKFIARAQLPLFDGTQEYCLWLGCMGAYDPHGREIIADFARIMDHLGTTFGVLKKEKCTGDPARRLGNDLLFQNLAEQGLATFAAQKVVNIVTICPHCIRTIATDWRDFGIAPHIEHHSEFLARHKSRLPSLAASTGNVLQSPATPTPNDTANPTPNHTADPTPNHVIPSEPKNPHIPSAPPQTPAEAIVIPDAVRNPGIGSTPETIVYHDPCYLGRYQNIYEAPRQVVSLAGELREAPRSHERSFCCGAGGGLAFLGEEKATTSTAEPPARIPHVRAQELAATGAQTIATACPFCNTMFRDSLAALAATTPGEPTTPPQLLDIAQLTARHLPTSAGKIQ